MGKHGATDQLVEHLQLTGTADQGCIAMHRHATVECCRGALPEPVHAAGTEISARAAQLVHCLEVAILFGAARGIHCHLQQRVVELFEHDADARVEPAHRRFAQRGYQRFAINAGG